MKLKNILKLFLFALVSAILIYILFGYVSLKNISQVFGMVSIHLILLGFILYLASYFFRALRFFFLLKKKIPFSKMLYIVFVHNFINSLLPFRTGELSYVYLVKKRGISLAYGATSIIIARIFDLMALLIFFLIATFFVADALPKLMVGIVPYVIFFLVLIILSLFLLILFSAYLLKRLKKLKKPSKLTSKLEEILHSISIIKSKHLVLKTLALSLGVWFFQFIMVFAVFSSLLGFGFWQIVITVSFPIISTVLPVQGIAGFGSIEGFWSVAAISFGIETNLAISSGFVFHLLLIFYFTVLGIIGLIKVRKFNSNPQSLLKYKK